MSRVRRIADRLALTALRAAKEFVEDRGHRDAAQIGFFVALSAVPLALLLVGAFGLLFDESEVRERVIRTAFDAVPVTADADRARLESGVRDALRGAGDVGPISVLLLLAAATGVMGALRHSINVAWDIEARPPLWRRKLLDLALVTGATLLLLASLALSATKDLSDRIDDEDGGGFLVALALDGLGEVLPLLFVAAVVLFLFRVLPMQRPKVREVWPGAVVAALGLYATKSGLELYLEHLADFGALYGSLGAIMALLLFVWIGAMVLVFGAEFASEWARLPEDDARVRAALRDVGSDVRRRRHRSSPGSP